MRTLLEEFWYGNVNLKEQKETLAKYDDCVNEMYGIIEREIFAYGFRLGGRDPHGVEF